MSEYKDEFDFEESLVDEVKETTKSEDLAKEFGIDAKISEVKEQTQTVISSPSTDTKAPAQAAIGIVNGAIGSKAAEPKKTSKKSKKNDEAKEEKVAVFSSRNVTWPEVGKVYRGYNIVTKSEADKWLTRDHVRLATPQEVAEEFGK